MKRQSSPIHPGVALLFVASLSLVSCQGGSNSSQVKANGNALGDLKGFDAINGAVTARLVKVDPADENGPGLARYLQGGDQFSGGLTSLLGAYVNAGGTTIYENGQPNALNLALWQVAFAGFALDAAKICSAEAPPVQLNDAFAARLRPLCAWPAPAAQDEQVMMDLWLSVMGFQAPQSEFTLWRNWFRSEAAYAEMPAVNVLPNMLVAIMMNPYFLLAQ